MLILLAAMLEDVLVVAARAFQGIRLFPNAGIGLVVVDDLSQITDRSCRASGTNRYGTEGVAKNVTSKATLFNLLLPPGCVRETMESVDSIGGVGGGDA